MTNNSTLPARPVAPREQQFPSLSICYRMIAQQEIWCMNNGGTSVQDYCNNFKSNKTPSDRVSNLNNLIKLINSGVSSGAPSADTCQQLAECALFDCSTGGISTINSPDPTRAYPCLTILYQYYVLDGNDECTDASIADLKSSLAGEMFSVKLVW